MDRTEQLRKLYELRHREHLKLKDALAQVGLADSTYRDIPKEEREAVEQGVIDRIAGEVDEVDKEIRARRVAAEQELIQTVISRMRAYIDRLDDLAMNSRRDDVSKMAIDTLLDIAREGIFVPNAPKQLTKREEAPALPPGSQPQFPVVPPPTFLQPTMIVFNSGSAKQEDVVDGEIVKKD